MADKERIDELAEACSQGNSSEEILACLEEVRKLQTSGDITLERRLQIQLTAFQTVRNLLRTTQSSKAAELVILQYLAPTSLLSDEPGQYLIRQHRDVLGEWLNELPDVDRRSIRAKVLEQALPLLDGTSVRDACSVISSIGYRDAAVVEALWKSVRSNDSEVGDAALSTLSWLGITGAEKPQVLQELHSRIAKRYNERLVSAVVALADTSSYPVILEHWLHPTARAALAVDASLAFSAIRDIADGHDDDPKLQDEIWVETTRLVEQDPRSLYRDFVVGHIGECCNSPAVVPTVFTWQGQHADWFDNASRTRYLAEGDMGKCVKPRQLEGWASGVDEAFLASLHGEACLDTMDDSYATTEGILTKEAAWKTILRLGYEKALIWFDAAVVGEKGRFVRARVMEYLACFRLDPLPDIATRWVVERYDDPGDNDARELSYRMAAVRIARSAATQDAFEHLLNFGFTYKGMVLTQSSDAVAEVALALMQQGHMGVTDRLVRVMLESQSNGQRLVSAHALESIAARSEYRSYLVPHTQSLMRLLYDNQRDEIERGLLLNVFSYLTNWTVPEPMLEDLFKWSNQPDRWIGSGSLRILANHGRLETHTGLMKDVLSLEWDGRSWRLKSDKTRFEWAPYIIGLLYQSNPKAFTSAIVSLLGFRDWFPVAQVARRLAITQGTPGQSEIPSEIVDALIRRVYERNSSAYGETEVLELLAKVAPRALTAQDWNQVVDSWMSDIRVALANALGQAVSPQIDLGRCLSTLGHLAEDSLYAVRRSAYRSLAKQSVDVLYGLCTSWLDSPLLKLSLRAAEASGWIENVKLKDGQDGFEVLYATCNNHVEGAVRQAAQKSWDERRRRLWAREYLNRIKSITGKDNTEILRVWCYGDALSQIGDDECRRELLEYASAKTLPPNVRYWMGHILEELDKNWRQTTQKWPEPWVDMGGAIESGTGKVILGSRVIEIQYSTWRIPAASPTEQHSWGGMMTAASVPVLNFPTAIIELEGGRRGQITNIGSLNSMATFRGTGIYPGFT